MFLVKCALFIADTALNNNVAKQCIFQNELAKACVQAGVPKRKIVVGIPFFGRSYKLVSSNATNVGDPALGPGSDGGNGIPISSVSFSPQFLLE